jgi:hypothetical protein
VFKSKRLSLLTIFALVVTSLSGLSASAANAAVNEPVIGNFSVNGTDLAVAGLVAEGTVVNIPQDTKSADLVISALENSSLEATIDSTPISVVDNSVSQTLSNLTFGDHTLSVRIFDPLDPTNSRNISSVTLRVVPMLNSLTVDGVEVADGATVNLEPNTTSVTVGANSPDNSTITIEGNFGLQVGSNEILVTVVNENNVTGVYTVTVNVPASSNTSAKVTINGEDISSGDNTTVPWGTTEVTVVVEVSDINATYFVNGDLALETGDNTVTVSVTAADTVTTEEYTFNVEVLENTDTSVNSITINGTSVVDGDEINVEALTTEISVDVDTVDTDATVVIVGDTELVVGGNLVTVSVTAADGATTQEYQFTVNVLLNTDTSVVSISIAGNEVVDGDFVKVEMLTTEVDVLVEVTDPQASYTVSGSADLVPGDNDLLITVTAADGETTEEYFFTITVLKSADTSVSSLEVNGESVGDGDILEVPAFTESVTVAVTTTDESASYVVDGNEGLVAGENTITITVTAADESTTQDYLITVNVMPNTDTSVVSINVAGTDVVDGETLILEPLTTEVDVLVELTDADASYEVQGGTDMGSGDNALLITVTAADGVTTQEYLITITVPLNSDTSIASLTVDGNEVGDADFVIVDALTTEVEVVIELTDPDAYYLVEGGSDLLPGDNALLITVNAADGVTTQEYFITITVLANTDTSLSSLEVNGESVGDGDVIEVPAFTEDVTVDATTTDELASFIVDGNEGLVVGENTVTITVTAADELTTQDYLITVIVAMSNDASAADLSVFWTSPDGQQSSSVADGDVVDLTPGTTEVEIVVEPTDAEATYEITGGSGLVLGANELVVVITAPDGEATETFNITLNVLPSSDATFSGIKINGQTWVEDGIVEVDAGDLDIDVTLNNEFANILVTPSGGARTEVRNGFGYTVASGVSQLLIEVTAQDGETVESATVVVWASTNVSVVPNVASSDGLLRVGTFVKLPRAQFDPAAKLTYSWLRDGEEIGATSAKYLLTAEDFGKEIRPVIAVVKKGVAPYSILGKPIEVSQGLLTKAPVPTIKGKPIVGSTLTAVTREWIEGAELAYQWYRDGEAIEGADSESYDLTGFDGGSKFTVGITGTLEGYESLEKMSLAVNVALGTLKYSDRPLIEGAFVTGGTLEVNVGSWLDEAEITIDWIRDGAVFYTGAADENTYLLEIDDYQSTIGVRINVAAVGYKSTSFTIKPRMVKQGTLEEIPTPTISGEPIVGELLVAEPGEYPQGAEFTYVWKRNGKVIQGSSDAAYVVNVRDVNTTITVKVIAKIPGYKTTRIDSDGVDITSAQ